MSQVAQPEAKQAWPVLQFDDARLRQLSARVDEADLGGPRLQEWISQLDLSRRVHGGIGIAAPQTGLFRRLVVIEIPAHERVGFGQVQAVPFHALVNPEIVWRDGPEFKAAEACLSVEGYEGFVMRPPRVGVVAYTPQGRRLEIEASGLYARCLQHEIDHLDGILYPDRIAELGDLRKVVQVAANDPVLARNTKLAFDTGG
ncbi:peptide deformylase [Pyxidicoccus trucidator]|uniref:peptide deformylase n=1 Tax=Pyxidicoccus trucidator TaxID=2709662 RepID=UPI0013DCE74A|nr:peptide deformylase [Pyxidicoccus trucidator]